VSSENVLRISSELSLPREAATWVFAYLAKRGAGKTYNAAVQAEEMLKAKIPIGVIDGMGIWWGLRVGADGSGAGLPIVVFGGEHADLPLVPERAAEIARAIVESNISFVLDLSGFSKTLMRKVVTAFLDELYRLNRVERHLFIEESDMFAPQKPFGPEAILCLSAVDNFIRRGGNRNLGCTLITQRSAVLNKDLLTQSDCLVILRTLAPQDKAAIQEWVKEQTEEDKEKLKAFYDSLKDLENGEAWVWHPEKPSIYVKVQFRCRETFHATREFIRSPKAAHVKLMDASEFISKFKAVFQDKTASALVNSSINNAELEALKAEVEGYRSGRVLPKVAQERINVLEVQEQDLIQKLKASDEYGKKMTQEEAMRCDQLEEARRRLRGFEGLQAALVAVMPMVSEEQITQIVERRLRDFAFVEMQKQEGAGAVSVTENIPEIRHRVEYPVVDTNETTRDGQLLTLACHGFFDEKRRLAEIGKEMQRQYLFTANNSTRDLPKFLFKLIELKVLQRGQSAQGGWLYWLADGAKDRIREVS